VTEPPPELHDDHGDADGAGSDAPADAVDDADDLAGFRTPMTRLLRPIRALLAAALALGLLVPAVAWLADELDFRRGSAEVVATVEGELTGVDAGATVLVVRTVGCAGGGGSGSAFVVTTPRGPALVTNRHVVERAGQVGVRTLDGDSEVRVVAVRVAAGADVAVLEVEDPQLLPPPLVVSDAAAAIGDRVRVVGFPAARPFTAAGEVTASAGDRLLVDVAVAPGASGSPVVAGDGTVVGQVRAVTAGGEALATPAAALTRAIATAQPHQPC
jgi:hypothetical protein